MQEVGFKEISNNVTCDTHMRVSYKNLINK